MPTLRLPSALSTHTGGVRLLQTAGATVGEAIDHAVSQFPALGPRLRDDHGQPYAFVTLYLNDEDVRFLQGFSTAVADDDEIAVVPAVAGG